MMLESIRYVDLVIPEEGWGQKEKDVDRFDVDVFVMGHDWEGSLTSLKISVKSFILTAQKVSQLQNQARIIRKRYKITKSIYDTIEHLILKIEIRKNCSLNQCD